MKDITLIAGKAQHGKDFTAEKMQMFFAAAGETTVIMHYADLLKFYARTYLGWNGKKDEHGRTLLQVLGTQVRKKDPDYWVNAVLAGLQVLGEYMDHLIIADCRFPNELDAVKEFFKDSDIKVVTVRVERPGFDNGLTETQKAHPSETALDGRVFDHVLTNTGDNRYCPVVCQFMNDTFKPTR